MDFGVDWWDDRTIEQYNSEHDHPCYGCCDFVDGECISNGACASGGEKKDKITIQRGDNMNVVQCKGEGQGSCKRCIDNGKWNRMWMCFLYEIEGLDGCYCSDCVKEIIKNSETD